MKVCMVGTFLKEKFVEGGFWIKFEMEFEVEDTPLLVVAYEALAGVKDGGGWWFSRWQKVGDEVVVFDCLCFPCFLRRIPIKRMVGDFTK